MEFNLFCLFTIIAQTLNFSYDDIQHDRFRRERLRLRSRYDPQQEAETSSQSSTCGSSRTGPLSNLRWMMTYNRNTWRFCLVILLHISYLTIQIVKCMSYSVLSNDRDSESDEYKNPTLRFLDSHYLLDPFRNCNRSRQLNTVMSLLFLQFLILRLRCLYMRYENAQVNRYQYKRINIVQLHMAIVGKFEATFSEWFKFFRFCLSSKCDHNSESAIKQLLLMKKLNHRLSSASKIDRVYYYNQIDFDACYEYRYLTREASKPVKRDGLIMSGAKRVLQIFAVRQSDAKAYVALPFYRSEPIDFFILFVAYVGGVFAMEFCSLYYLSHIWCRELVAISHGLEEPSFRSALYLFTSHPKSMIRLLDNFCSCWLIAVNVFDNAVLAYSSMLCHSRVNKVTKLLKTLVSFHRSHLENFCSFLDQRNLKEQFKVNSGLYSHQLKSEDFFSDRSTPLPASIEWWSFENLVADKHVSEHASAVADYGATVDQSSLIEYNSDLLYLIDLVHVVETELNDLKSFFTFYLNLNILFGAIGSALTFAVIIDSRVRDDLIISGIVSFVNLVPLINALFMAATSEGSVSDR